MAEVKSWILNVASVAVLMIILDLLMPEGKIKNFTQLVAGFVIMFVMVNPILQFVNRGVSVPYAGWQDEMYLLTNRFKYTTEALKNDQNRQVLELYRSMLVSDIKNRLESNSQISEAEVDVVINENASSDKYGEIRQLYINLLIDRSKMQNVLNQEKLLDEIRGELKQALSLDEEKIIIHINEGD